jgi:hypothetical protein
MCLQLSRDVVIAFSGIIIGAFLGFFGQWIITRRTEKRDSFKFLIALKANIVTHLFSIQREAILLRRTSYKYYFSIRKFKAAKEEQVGEWNDNDALETQKIHTSFVMAKQRYFEAVTKGYESISAFITFSGNSKISNLYKSVYDFDKHFYKKLIGMDVDDYLILMESDELEKSDVNTKQELEPVVNEIRSQLDMEINRFK